MSIKMTSMLSVALVIASLLPVSSWSQEPPTEFVTMPFDKAAEGLFMRSLPLSVAMPKDFVLTKNAPMWGNWLWTTPDSAKHLKEMGFAAPNAGVFQIRVATNIGYDRSTDTFICGPGCSEDDFVAAVKKAGGTDVVTERHRINGIPVFILEATMPTPEPYPSSKIYMAHIGLFIETNAALFTYTPPSDDPTGGKEVWAAAKKALLSQDKSP